MTKNNLEEKLLQSMEASGYSIDEVNMLSLSPEDAKGKIVKMMKQMYFDNDDSEAIKKVAQMKDNFMHHIYGVTDCPFELATGVCWEEMFNTMCIPVEENRLFKVVHPFFHIAVSSADYKKDVLYSSKDNPLLPRFEMRFYHSGRELVQIGQERYCYGEALVRMRRFDDTGTSPFLGVSHSVFVIDEKLIPNLLSQPEYKEVFMLLYTLYHISSHDGMMHGVFKDSSKAVQDVLSKDPIGSRFLGAFDGQCLTYEINYLRLTRHMFELCCKWNTTLKKDVESLYEQVCELTKHWPDVLGQYIRFIALNRVSRLIDTKLGKLPPLFVELLARSNGVGKVFVDDWYKMNFLIHTDHQKEALLFDDGPPVSYASMTRTMFDVYRDFYPK